MSGNGEERREHESLPCYKGGPALARFNLHLDHNKLPSQKRSETEHCASFELDAAAAVETSVGTKVHICRH